MNDWTGRTAVITGAASGFGLEPSRVDAARGMNLVMADVQQETLDTAAAEIRGLGAQVLAYGGRRRAPFGSPISRAL